MKLSILAVALGAAILPVLSASAAEPDPNRVIVTYKPGKQAQAESSLRRHGAIVHVRMDDQRSVAVSLSPKARALLARDPSVQLIEPDYPRYPMGQSVPYGIPRVQAPETVATGADGTGMKVCVIDSGIKSDHEDFEGIAMTGYNSPGGEAWDVDSCGHGTHVAGTIAAVDNATGVVGVSPGKVSLHIVKVFAWNETENDCTWAYTSTLIDAANRCGDAGAKVINMSLGGGGSSTAERTAFENLYANGVLSIAAAGNDGNSSLSYPASYDVVMSVAATDSADAKAGFSQFNSQVEIAAPGVDVDSTLPYRGSNLVVGGDSHLSNPLTGSVQAVASANLVSGGQCTDAELAAAGSAWNGMMVLCQRGSISFAEKTENATTGGADGVIIYNNAPGNFNGTLGAGVTSTIPAVSVSQETGALLVAAVGVTADLSTVFQDQVDGYGPYSGTSMATPHVAGVAAIAWSAKPDATPAEVRAAMTSTAIDLGDPGRDVNFGYGLVQALEATAVLLDVNAPEGLTVKWRASLRGGKQFNLAWSEGEASIDVWRNGTKVATMANTGAFSDMPGIVRGHGSLTYQVCNAGSTEECTAEVNVGY